jgi:lipoate-protein ligase A
LFSTSIFDLEKSINGNLSAYNDKSIKSVRSDVANVYNYLNNKISVELFRELLRNKITTHFRIENKYYLTPHDIFKINELVISKYQTWDWNYGYSPAYHFSKSTSDNLLKVDIDVKKGEIEKIIFSGLISKNKDIKNMEKLLIGIKHNNKNIENILCNSGVLFDDFTLKILIKLLT